MSSSVFYKFKNSREPERVTFDGTAISAFDLKRAILTQISNPTASAQFDLHIYIDGDEIIDDVQLIERSTTVEARRTPAQIRNQGKAQRYFTAKAPVKALNHPSKPAVAKSTDTTADSSEGLDSFFAESAQVWEQQRNILAHGEKVSFKPRKPVNVPDHPPPAGYVCYRCGQKGHWIQVCPQNDNPDFTPVPRQKRTTGIPRSMIRVVDSDTEGTHLDSDGNHVVILTDDKAWNKFQQKAIASKTQAANADAANKELEERGLLCPFEKETRPHMYQEPVATPCCEYKACLNCLENALADGDLICPNCSTPDVLIDSLTKAEDVESKMQAYQKEKAEKDEKAKEEAKEQAKAAKEKEEQTKDESKPVTTSSADVSTPTATTAATDSVANASDSNPKKRKDAPTDIKAPTAPKAMRATSALDPNFVQQMDALKNMMNAPISNMPNMQSMPNMANMPNMPMQNGNWNGFPQQNFQQQGFQQGFMPQQGFPNGAGFPQGFNGNMNNNMFGFPQNGGFPNQNMQYPWWPGE